jgi:hypothetical protein
MKSITPMKLVCLRTYELCEPGPLLPCYYIGVGGGGGEYTPQIGFGWTNGVALYLIVRNYNSDTGGGNNHRNPLTDGAKGAIALSVIAVVFFVGGYIYYRRRLRLLTAASATGQIEAVAAPAQVVAPLHAGPADSAK